MAEPELRDQHELRAEQLHRVCDPAVLGFETTAGIEPLTGALGQQDSIDALEFGLAMARPGYDIFVVGEPSSGRTTLLSDVLAERARRDPTPPDYCYVFNFQDPRRPRALALAAGGAPEFREALDRLVTDLKSAIPQTLGSETVAARRTAILEDHQKAAAEALDELRSELRSDPYVALVGNETSMATVPARGGEPLDREAYLRLPEEERNRIDEHVREASTRLLTTQRKVHEQLAQARQRIAELERETAATVVNQRLAWLEQKYAGNEGVQAYLAALADDVAKNVAHFISEPAAAEGMEQRFLVGAMQDNFFRRYAVNVLITNDARAGAPIVREPHPHLRNLLGRIEQHVSFGVASTDYLHIAPGALHRANGGYLILEAQDLLMQPLAWPALKRVLRSRELKPAEIASELGLLAGETLEPEPIPANLKVILVGEPELYYLLTALDRDLAELFKVKVDFRPQMERTPEAEAAYAQLVAARCQDAALPHFEAGAVAALIEQGSRLAGDQTRLTTRVGDVVDLVDEAAHWARLAGHEQVERVQVERAIAERDRRNRRPHRDLLDIIERGILSFEPAGTAVGQLHGIGLIGIGGMMFGRPIRVMASAYLGTGGVINIEREARLSGPIHSKGFLVLSGYLGWRFARTTPLILSASLSFEQMYEEVEGDSASVAELFALLSAIGDVPLEQGIAVTGAINQQGLVLPVGGVTEKLEGFYRACERKGLTGRQGVILPRRNLDALVVQREIREAVAEGRFHVWAIDTVEEGWPLISGRSAGEPQPDGSFPEGSVHRAVQERLHAWAGQWRTFMESAARTGETNEQLANGRP